MGVKTLYEYFYKLAYGDKGEDKAILVNDCLDIADAQIKANKDGLAGVHTQGTDQGLDAGGVNAVVVADVKDAVTKKHTQNTDTDLDATFEATFAKKADKLSAFAATTSAELAGVISDETGSGALNFGPPGYASGAKGYKSATNQTISHATNTKVVLDEEEFDVLNEFDKTTNYRFTVTVAGYYLFIGSCNYYPSVDEKIYKCMVYKNNAEQQCGQVVSSGTEGTDPQTLGICYLEASDYLELFTAQTSGANATLWKNQAATFLTVKRLY